jgi:hypothetical protein
MSDAFTPKPGPPPAPAACVRAWNENLPATVRPWIAGLRPYGALVYSAKNTVIHDTVSVTGPDCVIDVYFGRSQYAEIAGVWKNGRVTGWSGSTGSGRDISPNASVAADGRLRLY